jgi:hypothetical protein
MGRWVDIRDGMPEEKEEVAIRVRGHIRPACYRIGERWYALLDLDRWRMNTSPYWPEDRSWYLESGQIEAWYYEEEEMDPETGGRALGAHDRQ